MNSASFLARSMVAALLALLLAVRLLTPAGFMPAFDRGTITIVGCPDYEPAARTPMAHHHHGGTKTLHQPCPYAAGAAAGTLGTDFDLLTVLFVFAAVLLFGRTYRFLERQRAHERPPLRAPPLPA
jgi:membrane protein implicated in regulation of membrane protease activity